MSMSDNVSGPPAGESWSHRGEWHGLDVYANDDGDVDIHGIADHDALSEWLDELDPSEFTGSALPGEQEWFRQIESRYRYEIVDAMRAALVASRG